MASLARRNDVIVVAVFLLLSVMILVALRNRQYIVEGCKGGADSSYTIEDKVIGDQLTAKVLKNKYTGEYVEIVVDFGGRVEDLVLKSQSQGKLRSVLLTHNGNATAIKENAWWKGMLLVPWANRIAYGQYVFFNKSYQLTVNENTTTAQNALHGYLAKKKMALESSEVAEDYAALTLSHKFMGDEQGYPFVLDVIITYKLSPVGFKINIKLINLLSTSPLPVYVGWHPYFKCAAYKAVVTFDPCSDWNHVKMNSNFNPNGTTALYNGFHGSTPIGGNSTNPTLFDDCYKALQPPHTCPTFQTRLFDPETGQTVVLWQDSNFRFLQVFTGSSSLFGENAVAIEPMSGAVDGYNNHDHLTTLSGGESWIGEFGVLVE